MTLPTPTGLLTRTEALEIAKNYGMPVVVPNEFGCADIAMDESDTVHCESIDWALAFIRVGMHNDCLVQSAEGFTLEHKRLCPSCAEWYPISEFQNAPYYDRHSEGMETPEDNEECRTCIHDSNAHAEMVARRECFK